MNNFHMKKNEIDTLGYQETKYLEKLSQEMIESENNNIQAEALYSQMLVKLDVERFLRASNKCSVFKI